MTANNQVAEANVKYLAEIAAQVVPARYLCPSEYKHTEVGVIPEDWEVKSLGGLCNLKSGLGITAKNIDDFGAYACYGGNGLRGFTKSFTHDGKYALIGRQGALCGNVQYVTGKFFASEHALVATPVKDVNPKWLAIYLERMNLNQYSESSAQPGLSAEKLRVLKLITPTADEQTAIANALSDVDVLINELEKLIAKKQAIKTATMQQLLTGRTRLPQFALREDGTPKSYKQCELGEIPEDWKIVALNDLASIRSGGTPSTKIAEYWDGEVNWCTPTDITALQGNKYLEKTARTITELGVIKSAAEVLPIGTIVMTSRATIGECAIVQQEMTTNQGFKSFICNSMGNNEFLYYLLGTLKDRFIGLCSGSTFLEISTTQVRSFLVAIPEKEEQTAIATILSDMDEEIQNLQKRLAKTRQIKQGMMQELLTGRIRLISGKLTVESGK